MNDRKAWRWIAAVLLAYIAGFCLFYPEVFTSADEPGYVEQAEALAGIVVDPVSAYPPGTSFLQVPFVAAGGWRSAAWASVLSLGLTAIFLGRWLRQSGYSPAFALLFVAYAPTLVMGRLATSDLPSALVVTGGLWLLWTGGGNRRKWLLAGAVGGLSLLWRETNVAIFLPFVTGAAWRRERSWIALGVGYLAGLAAALLIHQALVDTPLGWGDPALWSITAALDSGPLYGLALLVLVPGGLVAVFAYRGPRRLELQAAVALVVAVYLCYGYSGQDSGPLERVAAAGRYFIPIVPLMTLAWADAVSRHLHWHQGTWSASVAPASVLAAAFAVHPVMHAWSGRDAAIARDIMATTAGGVTIADSVQRKFVAAGYGPVRRLWMHDVPPDRLAQLAMTQSAIYIIWVSRSDTTSMAELWAAPRTYVERAGGACDLVVVHDRAYGPARRLQIWRVRTCHSAASGGR